MGQRAYLDWNATAPLLPEARAAMLHALDCVGNPSSVHQEGRAARALLEAARADVAALIGAEAENIVFTSGATEAANAVFRQGLAGCCGRDIACALAPVVGASEHVAVLAAAGPSARVIPLDAEGRLDRDALSAALAALGPVLLGVQIANNETGILQDIPALAAMVHAAGGAVLVDAVQAPGKGPLDLAELGADALFVSAHKFGGPKGVGALAFADRRTRLASAFMPGGGQERGQRGGTENLAGIAGMGAAARAVHAMGDVAERLNRLRNDFENRLKRLAADIRIPGEGTPRLPNTSCFAIPGLRAEHALIALDLDGIALSSGSACSSGKVKASHVLKAMGEADWVQAGALRLSLGHATTVDEIERCLMSLEKLVSRRSKAVSAA